MTTSSAAWAFALAACLHAGFQATVTVLVYPALAEAGGSGGSAGPGGADDLAWAGTHARHSRRIVGLVGVVYALVAASGLAVLLSGPGGPGGPHRLVWIALVAAAGAPAVTALRAAGLHARLAGRGERRPELLAALLRADRWRCGFAVLAAILAVLAAYAGR